MTEEDIHSVTAGIGAQVAHLALVMNLIMKSAGNKEEIKTLVDENLHIIKERVAKNQFDYILDINNMLFMNLGE